MRKTLHAAAAAALLALPAQAASVSDPFSSFIVLGDSLSDNGSILPQAAWLAATGGAPYFDRPDLPDPGVLGAPIEEGGTFTNGDVWVQPLMDAFLGNGKLAVNFAVGGATADTRPGPAGFDLSAQAFAAGAVLSSPFAGGRPLVSAWFGANDIFGAFNDAGGPFGVDFTGMYGAAVAAANNVVGTLGALKSTFGVNDFLVPNMPDLGLTPLFATFAAPFNAALPGIATAAADLFNTTLASGLSTLALTGANIYMIDTNQLLKDATANPAALGYVTAAIPCVFPDASTASLFGQPERCASGVETTRLFVDAVHPEAGAHALIGQQAVAALTPVPLPAGAWLLLGGIGLLAARRRLG